VLHPVQPGHRDPPDDPGSLSDTPDPSLAERLEILDEVLGERLATLDSWVVPRLQRLAHRAAARLDQASRAMVDFDEGFRDGRPAGFALRHTGPVGLLVAVLLLSGTSIHLARFAELRGDGVQEITQLGGAPTGGGGTLAGGEAANVGPLQGTDVDAYIREREQALERLPSDAVRVAVVSFDEPLDAATITTLLDGLAPLHIQFINPQAAARPLSSEVERTILATIEGVVGAVRDMAREERDSAQALLDDGNVTDPQFARDYADRVVEMQAMLDVLDEDPAIVFAVVVEGSAGALRALSQQPSIRLVDVAPGETSVEDSGFWGLLPTDDDVVTFGRT
jgi:hypothetical protein